MMLKCLGIARVAKEHQEHLFERIERLKIVSTALESHPNVEAAQEMLRIAGLSPISPLAEGELPNQRTAYTGTLRQLIVLMIMAGLSVEVDKDITDKADVIVLRL